MKKIIVILPFFICFSNNIICQNFKPLSIGDTVPDMVLNNIINYKTSSAKLSDFKGKLLILDFWATWCGSCIANFPHNNLLKKIYGDSLQILNVSYEPKEKVSDFLSTLESRKGPDYSITTITNDTILKKIFPYMVLPHLIWIGSDRVVKAITGGEYLTENNINKVLTGKPVNVQVKRDIPIDIPLFINSDYITKSPFNFKYYSLFITGPFYDGAGVELKYFTKNGSVYGLNYTNHKIYNIIQMLGKKIWQGKGLNNFSSKRIVEDISDSDTAMHSFLKDTICQYSFFVPPNKSDSFYYKALVSFGQYIGLEMKLALRSIPCLVLSKTSDKDKIHTHGGRQENSLFSKDSCSIENCPVSYLVNRIEDLNTISLPVLDLTGYKDKVDLRFSRPYTLKSLREQLKKYDLNLIPAKKQIEVLAISSIN